MIYSTYEFSKKTYTSYKTIDFNALNPECSRIAMEQTVRFKTKQNSKTNLRLTQTIIIVKEDLVLTQEYFNRILKRGSMQERGSIDH